MRVKATITMPIEFQADVQIEANGLVCRVLPGVLANMGPHIEAPIGNWHRDVQIAAVKALEAEARRLALRPDPLEREQLGALSVVEAAMLRAAE